MLVPGEGTPEEQPLEQSGERECSDQQGRQKPAMIEVET
jgi:hypothetical protein